MSRRIRQVEDNSAASFHRNASYVYPVPMAPTVTTVSIDLPLLMSCSFSPCLFLNKLRLYRLQTIIFITQIICHMHLNHWSSSVGSDTDWPSLFTAPHKSFRAALPGPPRLVKLTQMLQ